MLLERVEEMKRKSTLFILFFFLAACFHISGISAQATLETSEMSTGGGLIESASYQHVWIMGQPSPAGWGEGGTFISGFIPGLFVIEQGMDIQAPEIIHTAITSGPINQAIDVTATASDFSGIERFYLYYRRAGVPSSLDSANFETSPTQIPAAYATQQGVEYFLTARDSAGNSAREPEEQFYSIEITFSGDTYVEQTEAQHHGSSASDYRIFSVPYVLDTKTPSSVLEIAENFGSYDASKWRFFAINNTNLLEYDQIKSQAIINPGRGFLLITSIAGKQIRVRNGHSPNIETYSRIPLVQGWNLVGNPFDFDIPVNNLHLASGSGLVAWVLGANLWVDNPSVLRRWSGLAVHIESGPDTLLLDAVTGMGKSLSFADRYFTGENWGYRIMAESKGGQDLCNYAGISAEEEKVIWAEPPQIDNAVSLCIKRAEETGLQKASGSNGGRLAAVMEAAGEGGNLWDLELTGCKEGEKAEVRLEGYGELPEGYDQYLLDCDWKIAYDVSSLSSPLEVKMGSSGKRNLRLLAGSKDFIKSNSNGIAVYPEEYLLRQNFPNPFNPVTTVVFAVPERAKVSLDIYNILGQKVRTLLNAQAKEEGYHVMEWDSRNDRGIPVASGMYIIRFVANGHVKIKKAMLIR